MRLGYKRVSTIEQNTARQLDDIEVDKVYEDKCSVVALPTDQSCNDC